MRNLQPDIDPFSIPGFVLWQASKLWQRHLTAALKPCGVGSTELVVLGNVVRLSLLRQQATPLKLMAITKVDRMTASQTLRSLQKKGLVTRSRLPGDQRTFRLRPTKAGLKLADDALGLTIRAHEKFFGPLKGKTNLFLDLMRHLIVENSNEPIS